MKEVPKQNAQLKVNNLKTIFRIVQKGSRFKKEIESLSGLSWGTVSMLTNELVTKKILIEVEDDIRQVGRTPKRLCINRNNNLFLGIDINISGITYVVTSLAGDILHSFSANIVENSVDGIIGQLLSGAEAMIGQHPAIVAIALSMQGFVDSKNGISIASPHFKNWKYVNLKKVFEDKFKLPTGLYHDPDCLMEYEMFKMKNIGLDVQNCLVLRIDDGIGLSILLGRKIFNGMGEMYAELGHTILVPNGRECVCGKRGCLESYCSLSQLTKNYNEQKNIKLTTKEALDLLENGDADMLELLTSSLTYLGIAISNLINLLAPQVVCLGGVLLKNYADGIHEKLIKTIGENTKYNNAKIKICDFNTNQPAIGAIYILIDELNEQILQV